MCGVCVWGNALGDASLEATKERQKGLFANNWLRDVEI